MNVSERAIENTVIGAQVRVSFWGKTTDVSEDREILSELRSNKERIVREIEARLSFTIDTECKVDISFESGSVVWHGVVTFLAGDRPLWLWQILAARYRFFS